MTDINSLYPSNYLKKEDVGNGMTLTISQVRVENVAPDGQAPENKPVIHFHEDVAPLVLNRTNGTTVAMVCGTNEIEQWGNKKITLFNDPNIMFGGRRVGGIRVQMPPAGTPMQGAPVAPAQQPAQQTGAGAAPSGPDPMDDGIPFAALHHHA